MAKFIIVDQGLQLAFQAFTSDPANATTYSFTDVAIGAADSTRRVLVSIRAIVVGTVSSVTIAGVTATIHEQANGGNGVVAGIASVLTPTGSTATVAVTLSTQGGACFVASYRQINESITSPFDTLAATALSGAVLSGTIDLPNSGAALAVAGFLSTTAGNSWVGVTEDYDQTPDTNMQTTGASDDEMAQETNRTVSATNAGSPTNGALVAVSWG